MPATYNILIMGASYGSLLASKLLFGGHQVKLVCLPAEADLINAEGFRVSLPVDPRAVSYWDVTSHAWKTEAGCHPVLVGSSSRDIRLQGPGLDASLKRCGPPH